MVLMPHHAEGGVSAAPLIDSSTMWNWRHEPLVTLEYFELAPARIPQRAFDEHLFIIPADRTPTSVSCHRDGAWTRLDLGPTDLAIVPAGTVTAWRWYEDIKVVLLWIKPEVLRHFAEIEMRMLLTDNRLRGRMSITDPGLVCAAQMLRDSLLHPDVGTGIVFDSFARIFLAHLIQTYGVRSPASIANAAELGVERYRRIVDHVEDNLHHRIEVAELAEIAGMSRSVFVRAFKSATDQSPAAFVRDLRSHRARDLLEDSTLSIGEIAARCGFADQAHLSRTMKRAFGSTPRALRGRARNGA